MNLLHSLARIALGACLCSGAALAITGNPADPGTTSLSLAMRASIEQCKNDLAAAELDPIRQKADPSRKASDGPPTRQIASNDSFATDTERPVIAQWIIIRNRCLKRFDALLFVPPTAAGTEATSLRQVFTLTLAAESNLGELIQALYEQKLTYGEFAKKRYEFTRDAADLNAAINEVGLEQRSALGLDDTGRRLSDTMAGWKTYLSAVKARRPRSVHVVGGEGAS